MDKKGHAQSRSIFNICPRRAASSFSPFSARAVQIYLGISHSDFITRKVYPRERNPYSLSRRETPFSSLLRAKARRLARRAVKRVAFMRRAKVSGEKPRSRAVLSLKSASELSLARDPTRAADEAFPFLQRALG